jgi:hypothetical protein
MQSQGTVHGRLTVKWAHGRWTGVDTSARGTPDGLGRSTDGRAFPHGSASEMLLR